MIHTNMRCRHCHSELNHVFVDLGAAPPSNAYLSQSDLNKPETYYPLRVLVCENCWLVQTEDFAGASELFDEHYGYFSSVSTTWLAHAKSYVEQMVSRFRLSAASHVVEVAANDGYLLQHVQAAGIPCLGIEPTKSTAQAARTLGLNIVEEFFGVDAATSLVSEGHSADLTVANNVLAHVPDINDFVRGFAILLKPDGVATFEFPHLLELVAGKQFDTIYHEHYSYLSLTAVQTIFSANGLSIFDVEQLPTHGGSLRVFAQRTDTGERDSTISLAELLQQESSAGIQTLAFYQGFQGIAESVKNEFLTYLLNAKRDGKCIAAYGAAAKGNTLLNFAGIRKDLIEFVVDRSPGKQGKYLPGSRIPIVSEETLRESKPDVIAILPWNIKEEVASQLSYAAAWDASFITAIPSVAVQPLTDCSPVTSVTSEPAQRNKRIPYTKPSITQLEISYARDAAENGWGEHCYDYIYKFEAAFKEHLGVKHAIATSSCTGALHMGMAALGIGPGDEVILADTNWIATAAPIVHLGAKPVFVDILSDTWCIDPNRVEQAITNKTRAIVATHLYGNLCDMHTLLEIGKRYSIPIIEDAAEAIGSIYHGKRAGSMGIFGAFSFHGTKTVTTGEGGMFVTNDAELYESVLTLSNHGRSRSQSKQFWADKIGYKYKMSNIQAAIGCAQLERVNTLVDEKKRIFERYHHNLKPLGINVNPLQGNDVDPGYWMVNAVFPKKAMDVERREQLIERLRAARADARVFFWPLSSLGHFEVRFETPRSYDVSYRSLNLPTGFGITDASIEDVCETIRAFLNSTKRLSVR